MPRPPSLDRLIPHCFDRLPGDGDGRSFAEMSADARSEAMRKITWRALWWFRYAALLTFLFGLSIIAVQGDQTDAFFEGQHGTAILTGILFGVTMWMRNPNMQGLHDRFAHTIVVSDAGD